MKIAAHSIVPTNPLPYMHIGYVASLGTELQSDRQIAPQAAYPLSTMNGVFSTALLQVVTLLVVLALVMYRWRRDALDRIGMAVLSVINVQKIFVPKRWEPPSQF